MHIILIFFPSFKHPKIKKLLFKTYRANNIQNQLLIVYDPDEAHLSFSKLYLICLNPLFIHDYH